MTLKQTIQTYPKHKIYATDDFKFLFIVDPKTQDIIATFDKLPEVMEYEPIKIFIGHSFEMIGQFIDLMEL